MGIVRVAELSDLIIPTTGLPGHGSVVAVRPPSPPRLGQQQGSGGRWAASSLVHPVSRPGSRQGSFSSHLARMRELKAASQPVPPSLSPLSLKSPITKNPRPMGTHALRAHTASHSSTSMRAIAAAPPAAPSCMRLGSHHIQLQGPLPSRGASSSGAPAMPLRRIEHGRPSRSRVPQARLRSGTAPHAYTGARMHAHTYCVR